MEPSEFKKIYNELITVYQNLKAEVLLAEIQENTNLTPSDFNVNHKSTFTRPYRRDMIDVNRIDEDDPKLTLNLSRNGLYDHLPEGLFHSKKSSKKNISHVEVRKEHKKEEKDARLFFAPFENEFFYQKFKTELDERSILNNFYSLDDDFLIDFWKIDKKVPKKYALKLVKLLPYSYKIAGDLELTRLSLEEFLDEKVSLQKKFAPSKIKKEKTESSEITLGVSSVLNSDNLQDSVLQPILEVTIGPLKEDNVTDYLKKDGILTVLRFFYDFFIPLEQEVITKFAITNDTHFLLSKTKSPVMGISTKI